MRSRKPFLIFWPQYFDAVLLGKKTFEVRKNDRDFSFGDDLILKEFDPTRDYIDRVPGPLGPPKGYTGRELKFQIGFILPISEMGIKDSDLVVFSLLPANTGQQDENL